MERGATSDRLLIGDFKGEYAAWHYVQRAYSPEGYMPQLGREAILLAISERNWEQLQGGLSLEAYMNFMADSLVQRVPTMAIPLERYAILKQEAEQQAKPSSKTSEEVEESGLEETNLPVVAVPVQSGQEPEEESNNDSTERIETPKKVSESQPITYDDVRRLERERKVERKSSLKKRNSVNEPPRRLVGKPFETAKNNAKRSVANVPKPRRNGEIRRGLESVSNVDTISRYI